MIWTDDNGQTWYSAPPIKPHVYSKNPLGPFATRREAIDAMDAAFKEGLKND